MEYSLSKPCLSIATALAKERTLCAFDCDGTLSAIAERPDMAIMSVRTWDLLRNLAALYPCIIVSGRARADVLEKLNGINVTQVIGDHGAETGGGATASRNQIDHWRAALEPELEPVSGV
jgi:trehalose 6-phosphate phosphatase